jgi:phosphatidylserine/phosphatidylglycerophosphate/cardiolipin synthase-like enzyme
VQSGNYSANSIPLNVADGGGGPSFRTGNRDTGLAIRSAKLAALFTEILQSDMALVTAGPEALVAAVPEENVLLVEQVPTQRPSRLFPSEQFQLDAPLEIQPVLSPDNYMDVVPGLLKSATTSITIEQQYIKANQPNVRILLDAVKQARANNPALEVRIVLGKIFDRRDLPAEHRNLDVLANDYGLKLDTNIRYINTNQLVHCHNKMIIIDGVAVLVSSQNWSDFAVTKNREAGLWMPHGGIAQYFDAIFDVDWSAAFKSPDEGFDDTPVTREALSAGGFIRVERADYEEV